MCVAADVLRQGMMTSLKNNAVRCCCVVVHGLSTSSRAPSTKPAILISFL
ncbi:hypothetical protein BsWGS_16194 [Bradybaena similaris]